MLALALAASAQPQFTPAKTVVNVGELMFQAPRSITFQFTNTGDAPLQILDVRPSCGCTSVAFSQEPVEAGATGTIVATYDAATLGVFVRELEVTTNAADEPVYLAFQGKVTTDPHISGEEFPVDLDNIRLLTKEIGFGVVSKGARPVVELQILNTSREAYRPQLMHLPPYLTAQYEPQLLSGGRVGRIMLTLDSDEMPLMGLTQTNIYIARYNGEQIGNNNEIQVAATLIPAFSGTSYVPHVLLSADTLDFTAPRKKFLGLDIKGIVGSVLHGKNKESATVTITNTGVADLVIHRIQVFDSALGASLGSATVAPGGKTKLKITVDKTQLDANTAPMRVLLITNDPQQPKVEVIVKTRNI